MKRTALISSLCITFSSLVFTAAPASAASFCDDKIPGATQYQHDFSYGGSVVATICAPIFGTAGTAYLYARGTYASVQKYMSLSISVVNGSTYSVSGNYTSYIYRAIPAGGRNYHAVMYDGHGNKIVDGTSRDYE